MKFSINSERGLKGPPSTTLAASSLTAAQTPSVLRNTIVSFPEPKAAVATTNPTVALSPFSLHELIVTQKVSLIIFPFVDLFS